MIANIIIISETLIISQDGLPPEIYTKFSLQPLLRGHLDRNRVSRQY